jgi:putative ABC transport system permease protein
MSALASIDALPLRSPRERDCGGGGMAARRAVSRWAWRLFRHEWRQQLLVLALVMVAVATTILGSAVATNNPPPASSGFGTAQDAATFSGADPHVSAQIASVQHRFGRVDVIADETLPIPGSVGTYDLRAQEPHGAFGQPMLGLLSGRYPAADNEVALSPVLASRLGLGIGDVWHQGGKARTVVGIVQNPQSLLDEFALVPPGQVPTPSRVTVLFDAPGLPPGAIGPNVSTPASVANSNPLNPQTVSLAVLTLGMILIALVAVGGFTVLAQRRLRSLGMLASIGATDRNVGQVVRANGLVVGIAGAVLGSLLGFAAWLLYRPSLEQSAHHVIGVWALPWLVVTAAIVLAIVATYLAAARPARSVTRIPIVAALAGQPAPPRQIHRSAVPGIVFLVIAFLLLGYSGGTNGGTGSGGSLELVLGLMALLPAVILLAPFCLTLLARLGRRAPVAIRLALRDLARYRARSGSALAAASIGVMIAVIVAVLAQSRYADILDPAGPNLAPNQLLVWTNLGNPNTGPTTGQVAAMTKSADSIAAGIGAQSVIPLETSGADGSANLSHSGSGRPWSGSVYVATPQLLKDFGITPSQINPDADILTSLPGLSGISNMSVEWCTKFGTVTATGPSDSRISSSPCLTNGGISHPVIQEISALPSGVHAPNTVITEYAIKKSGLENTISVQGWLIQTAQPLTAAQVHDAQSAAAAAGNVSIESRDDEPTSAQLVNWATAAGIAIALCILAMSVGLIRSETASDLRTLAAAGASTGIRRTITAATAGALGLLGGVLGTFAGYAAVVGWLRDNSLNGGISALGNVPVTNLLVLLIGTPIAAAAIAWLLAGREPAAMAHQPIE